MIGIEYGFSSIALDTSSFCYLIQKFIALHCHNYYAFRTVQVTYINGRMLFKLFKQIVGLKKNTIRYLETTKTAVTLIGDALCKRTQK